MEDDDLGYDYYRASYIRDLRNSKFPWEAAYYYYSITIDRIDIMGFHDFKETIQLEHLSSDDGAAEISEPIYTTLDRYFEVCTLLTAQNTVLTVL